MTETWTILKVLEWTAGRFAERGIESARLDAEVLLAHVLGQGRVYLYTHHDQPLLTDELARFRELIRRRLQREPVAYLVGEQEFWSLPLAVDARVLVPRRDTETLVEVALRHARTGPPRPLRFADVGTGSGAVALALARELPEATVDATDASVDALAVARANAARHELEGRVRFLHGDLVTPLEGVYDVVVSNPPYVPTGELARLLPEVRHEPRGALDGGHDGLDVLRRLVPAARERLAPGGLLAVEHGWDQGPRVASLFGEAGYGDVATTKDLAARDRVTSGRRM